MSATDALGESMSLDQAFDSFTEPEAEAPTPAVESGQGEAEAPQGPARFDPSSYSDHVVALKVDGEEIEVPLSEALAGYQRQAHFTRSQQALAEQRRELEYAATLQAALRERPAETIALLQEQFGLVEQPQAADEDWLDDPIAAEVAQLKSWRDQMIQQQQDQYLYSTLERLSSKYGEDFDPREVASTALRMGVGVDHLEDVYKAIAFDKMMARQQGAAEFQAAQQQRESQVEQAKAAASQLVYSGGSVGEGAPAAPPRITSVEDAWAAAEAALGAPWPG